MILFLLACDGGPVDTADTADTADSAGERAAAILALTGDGGAGGTVYGSFCSSCHGYGGEGDIGPAMAEVVPGAAREHLVDVVLNGWDGDENASRMSGMPTMADQDIADVVQYLIDTWGP
jgi:mono/diheme cytochrome c family protein